MSLALFVEWRGGTYERTGTMLSPKTISIVKATAPVVAENAEVLTKHFYQRMFRENPEVIPFFNQAHQNEGRQQKALAAAICAYAANIDRLEVLGPAVELIAQKHASLKVKAAHYPIVGRNLLASIREVLGQAATEDIVEAWGEAYSFLAKIFIDREQSLYAEHVANGAWEDFKNFVVIKKERESELITSFYLQAEDGSKLPHFRPGQYITVRCLSSDGRTTTMRNYSLSDKPGQPWFRISVKREYAPQAGSPDGYVSKFLHEQAEVGSVLEVGAPCGEFFLDPEASDRPLVLMSAGVGITPIFSMLAAALEEDSDRTIRFIQAARHRGVGAFRAEVDELCNRHKRLDVHFRYSEELLGGESERESFGFVDDAYLQALDLEANGEYYLCGPEIFIVKVKASLEKLGISSDRIHYELFGPKV